MIELLATSFPVFIQYFLLKRRGEAITAWNMKTAVFLWAIMAFALFFAVFYFHPKSYSGLLPFRTVSVVAQTSGPVTNVFVRNGQEVSKGDFLFSIEDSKQQAQLNQAEAEYDKITGFERKAEDALKVAEAAVTEARTNLNQQRQDLANNEKLLSRGAVSEDKVRKFRTSVGIAEARLAAALAQLNLARTDLTETIPAQRKAAEAAVQSAQVALDKTFVKSFADGIITQMAMSVGSPASQLIISPALVIIPKRSDDEPRIITAGFAQVSRDAIYEGMPAEVACETNTNIGFRDSILPARIVSIQPAIATGQVVPGGNLLEPRKNPERGSVLAYLELLHGEHEDILIDGSGCLVQTYTNNIEGLIGHVIAATGVVKAAGLRLKVWGTLLVGVGLVGGGH